MESNRSISLSVSSSSTTFIFAVVTHGSFTASLVDTEVLGKAFEPEQRFENNDGSAIVFDRDYLGNTRGVGVLPGPFASADAAEKTLW